MRKFKSLVLDIISAFFSLRVGTALLFQLFFIHYFTKGIRQLSLDSNCGISIWNMPFIYSYVYMQFFYGIMVTYIFSSVPFMTRNQLYYVMRYGRRRWIISKFFRILGISLLLSIAQFVISVIVFIPHLEFGFVWGKLSKTIALTNAASMYDIRIPFSYLMMNHFTPLEATCHVLIRMSLATAAIGLIMFAVSLLFKRIIAVMIGAAFAIFAIVNENMRIFWEWFKYISPFSWLNLDVMNKNKIGCLAEWHKALALMIVVMMVCIMIVYFCISKIDFVFTDEKG